MAVPKPIIRALHVAGDEGDGLFLVVGSALPWVTESPDSQHGVGQTSLMSPSAISMAIKQFSEAVQGNRAGVACFRGGLYTWTPQITPISLSDACIAKASGDLTNESAIAGVAFSMEECGGFSKSDILDEFVEPLIAAYKFGAAWNRLTL